MDSNYKFSENPVQYSLSLGRNIVRDYWDIVPAILGPIAFNDTGNEIFGDPRFLLMIGGPTLSAIYGLRDSVDRLNRNMNACVVSFAGSTAFMNETPVGETIIELSLYALAAVFTYATFYCDRLRIRNQNNQSDLERKIG